jgi:FtsP/CotA-like multicopper oxidase with cupredoxin domain
MAPISRPRRPRLALAALGAAAALTAIGATSVVTAAVLADDAPPCEACQGFVTGQPLRDLPASESSGGSLSVTLTPKTRTIAIGGRKVSSQTYGPNLMGDAWVVSPGDQLNVNVRNRLPVGYLPAGQWADKWFQPKGGHTNLHVHGMHVSPNAPSDDIFLDVPSGSDYQYQYAIPADHRPGIYWYHPHAHRYADMQTFAGQAGPIVVRGGLDDVPGIGNLRDRSLFIQNTMVVGNTTVASQAEVPSKRVIPVNGQIQPKVDIHPGESQRLRLWNASTERFLQIRPTGGEYWILARDGNTLTHPVRSTLLQMGPGQRLEVLVRAPRIAGHYPLIQTYFDQRPTPFGKQPEVKVATLSVAGPAQTPQPVPQNLSVQEDLRGASIAERRSVTFQQNPGIAEFYVNGKVFASQGRIKTVFRMKLGTTEEWILRNRSPEWHNFHIHINDFQVVARNGKAVTGQPNWQDSVTIPPQESVTIRQRYTDFTGRFVFHCHVLVHEDHGMMAAVEVVP